MSRTIRRARPRFHKKRTTVRDGEPQYVAAGCKHNNRCSWCSDGRTHSSRRRAPIEE